MAVPTPFVSIVVILVALAAFGAFVWIYRLRADTGAAKHADRLRARYQSGRISQEEFVRLSRADQSRKPSLPKS